MAAGKKNPEEKNTDTTATGRSLRDDAEEQLAHSPERLPDLKGQTPEQLIHELRVHQIELETQAEELRKAHLALEESRDKYLDLYEFAPNGYLTFNENALITDVNLNGMTLLKVPWKDVVNHGFGQFIVQEDLEQWDKYFMHVRNLREKQCCTLMLKRGDGSRFPARLEGTRTTDSRGANTIRVAFSDITDIWQIEALRESEKFNRNLVEHLPEYIIVYGPDGKILYVNPSSATALGYDAESVVGTSLLSYVAGEHREEVVSRIAERREGGEVPSYEIDLLTRDGGRRSVVVKGTLIQYSNRPAVLLLLVDITERKQVENALQLSNKKINLLAGITRHDINNQLAVLVGYLSILEKKQLDSSFKEYFLKIATAAQRISAMIQFTKEYENIGVNAPVWQDCRTLIDTAAKQAPLGQVVVKNDLPAGAEVFADPLIIKVCYNLMDNAVRHGGKILTIRFSCMERDGNHVVVCEDDGDGVLAEEKERIFERGFGKNTGLGLALSKEILDITGITIRETGEPGKGARFEMMVPKGAYRVTS